MNDFRALIWSGLRDDVAEQADDAYNAFKEDIALDLYALWKLGESATASVTPDIAW